MAGSIRAIVGDAAGHAVGKQQRDLIAITKLEHRPMPMAEFLELAISEAQKSFAAGGIPIGSVLVRDNRVIGAGHNKRVQLGDAIAHGEMDCIRNAGRQRTYRDTTIYTTLSPCMMCSGTIVQFGIPRVIIGENTTFGGNEEFLRSRGVEVIILADRTCRRLMEEFIKLHPDIWKEDIGED